jgi:hypothetical protein
MATQRLKVASLCCQRALAEEAQRRGRPRCWKQRREGTQPSGAQPLVIVAGTPAEDFGFIEKRHR